METTRIKRFAQYARRTLMEQVATKLKQVLLVDSPARRSFPQAVEALMKQLGSYDKESGRYANEQQVVDKVAYIWFNRFCALRFMDVNEYTSVKVLTPRPGDFQPEILSEAKMGELDEEIVPQNIQKQVIDLLNGETPSHEPHQDAYRLLIVAVCNYYHSIMPFLFEKIADYTELLMPEDLLSGNSIVAYTREAMTPGNCESVEVIGWLYQFYISEKKDEVFASKSKVTAEEIPAATQLFTPHYIVRYMVQNSLGRLWMLNRPESKLTEQMDYYIKPDQDEEDFLRLSSPEELKICDPACGSGHILLYAYDLLYDIYEEEGYESKEIPQLILENNLYGIELDERAGELAAFALAMKAAKGSPFDDKTNHRRFFRNPVQPHICVLQNIKFQDEEKNDILTLKFVEECQNFLDETSNFEKSNYWKAFCRDYKKANNFVPEDSHLDQILKSIARLLNPEVVKKHLNHTDLKFYLHYSVNDCVGDNEMLEEYFFSIIYQRVKSFEESLLQLNEFDNLGSLLKPSRELLNVITEFSKTLDHDSIFQGHTINLIDKLILQGNYLSDRYNVVVANPPYMGGKGMNKALTKFAKEKYPDSKADLFAMFMERSLDLVPSAGYMGMVNMQSWMFLSSFEKLRTKLLNEKTILSMAHLGPRGFDSIGGEVVQTTSFVLQNQPSTSFKGSYLRLIKGRNEEAKQLEFKDAINSFDLIFQASARDFKVIPGSPIAYWLSPTLMKAFSENMTIGDFSRPKVGLNTTDNAQFLRAWHEVAYENSCFGMKNKEMAIESKKKWFPYNKGGSFRKWYGNNDLLINWRNDGDDIKTTIANDPAKQAGGRIVNEKFYFKEGITWTFISSNAFGVRYTPQGALFDVQGSSMFPDKDQVFLYLGYLGSKLAWRLLKILNPTVSIQSGNISALPWSDTILKKANCAQSVVKKNIELSRNDWDSYETSYDFQLLQLLSVGIKASTLTSSYQNLCCKWQSTIEKMQLLEEENNRIFIEAYGLQDELTPEVPIHEITLTCNPVYRYGDKKNNAELEDLLVADTMKEFISYVVGCIFGRYSLDKEGLILANQGETLEDYLQKVDLSEADLQFIPDEDNVIPVLEEGWFEDDIVERFRVFLKTTFGEDNYEENLTFLEKAIGKDLRKYFLKDFYTEHNKMYKKRPIYWMFSSPKGSFNALIYMHRYRPDTVSIILNDYLREYRTKLEARKDHLIQIGISVSASQGEKTKALKEQEKLTKVIDELEAYERDILYPLASEQKEIDLDDGVKVNYNKFGKALKKVTGLSGK